MSVFFPQTEIKTDRWNKVFPYRLLIWDVKKNTLSDWRKNFQLSKANAKAFGVPYVISNTGPRSPSVTYFMNGSDYIISQSDHGSKAVFSLPITPQQIQIVDQYAINTTATARGVVEEHNGVKFKMINIQASTGILASRKSQSTSSITGPSIASGTVDTFNKAVSSAKAVSAFAKKKPLDDSEFYEDELTGYAQALMLSNFLDGYAELKKDPKNKNLRLIFDIPKQNQSYIVTPLNFSLTKTVQSPNEFIFSLQMKAWKRIDLETTPFPSTISPKASLNPSNFTKYMNTIANARKVISNSVNVIKAVRSDFNQVFEAIRQTAAVVKDLAGAVLSIAELPGQIISDAKSALKDAIASIKQAGQILGQAKHTLSDLFHSDKEKAKVNAIAKSKKEDEGKPTGQAQTQKASSSTQALSQSQSSQAQSAVGQNLPKSQIQDDSMVKIIQSPEANFSILNAVNVDQLQNLSQTIKDDIQDEQTRLSLITQDDLNQFKQEILTTIYLISDRYGAGDPTLSYIYNKPNPSSRVTPLTMEETEIMTALMEIKQVLDALTSTEYFDRQKQVSPLDYVGNLANNNDITFGDASAKILVPVPFNMTIEQISARYLNDSNRWLEIVILNNLRMPYIDEEGFTLPLLSNAIGRQLNVNDQNKQLYLGQNIILSAINIPPFTRKIINIEKISDTNYLVTVDGEDNLSTLTTSNNAQLKGYLAGTVNSQNQIFIPSEEEAPEDDLIILPKQFQADKLAKISKIDWLLDDNGDLAINKVGEIQLAGGTTNLVQALKLKVKTKKGTLLQHLNYGLGLTHGISVADIEQGVLLQSLQQMILDDGRFSGIQRMNIRISGSTMFIEIAVTVAGGTGTLPITFEI